MADREVCAPPLAEPDSQTDNNCVLKVAPAPETHNVTNTEIDRAQVRVSEEEALLKTLLTDSYCHVCESVLAHVSQRTSHYQGKKHAQKLRAYLQTVRGQRSPRDGLQRRSMPTDRDRFCELCNMLFSSAVVAKSHYEGKVHCKNLRKHSLHSHPAQTASTSASLDKSLVPVPVSILQQESNPDRYCSLCCISFDNKQMSLQHYNGKKHQRRRQLRTLGDKDTAAQSDPSSASVDKPPVPVPVLVSVSQQNSNPDRYCDLCCISFDNKQMSLQHYNGKKHQRRRQLRTLGDKDTALLCQICSIQFSSKETLQAHLQENKHHNRTQQNFSSFTEELQDYIQTQKARGITPTFSSPHKDVMKDMPKDTQKDAQKDAQKNAQKDTEEQEEALRSPLSTLYPPPSGFCPLLPPWGWGYTVPHFTGLPSKRRHRRDSSSSSSGSSSFSISSSSSSSSSGSRDRGRRKRLRTDEEERRDKDKGTGECRDRNETRHQRRQGRQEVRGKEIRDLRERSQKEEEGGVQEGGLQEGGVQEGVLQEKPERQSPRRERRRAKDTLDQRTEEEKLWDECILGC